MTSLVISEYHQDTLAPSVYSLISAAAGVGGDIDVLVIGHQSKVIADQAAYIKGIRQVLLADSTVFESGVAEILAAQITKIASHYSHIFFAANAAGKNIAPRVAALLDVAQISSILAVHNADTFERAIYAGNAIATVVSQDVVKVITVQTTAFDGSVQVGSAPANIQVVPIIDQLPPCPQLLDRNIPKSDRPDLAIAKIIVAGGRGLGSAENFQRLEPLARQLGAALGASRAAVDAGYAPNDWQIGQTGRVVAPLLYIAVGISGAVQHLAGMKDSKVIVAINKDPEAPIFQVADYGLVADWSEVLPQLLNLLASA